MKKLALFLLSFFLLTACSSNDVQDEPESVHSIQLEVMTAELYKGKPIEILMTLDSDYQLCEDDFNIFGGTIEIKNKHTAFITYNSAGTFHVSCHVGDVASNELTLQVRTSTASNGLSYHQTQQQTANNQPQEPPKKDPNDFTDWENIRDASSEKVTTADSFYANSDGYTNQEILLEGNVPQNSDGTYIVTSDGQQIPLSGLEMSYAGPVRLYGTYDGNSFHVYSYCSFGGEVLKTEEDNE